MPEKYKTFYITDDEEARRHLSLCTWTLLLQEQGVYATALERLHGR